MGKLSNLLASMKNDFASKIELSNQSITWWERELDKLFVKLDSVEDSEWYAEKDEDYEKTMEKIHVFLARGRFEFDNLQALQAEMDSMLDMIKDELAPKAMRIDINVRF